MGVYFVCSMFGEQIIGVMEVNDQVVLTSPEKLKYFVLRACESCSFNVVGEKYHLFDSPKGITYCFILSQSHFIIHSWPEDSKLVFNLFTCSEEKNSEKCVEALAAELNGKIVSIKKLKV